MSLRVLVISAMRLLREPLCNALAARGINPVTSVAYDRGECLRAAAHCEMVVLDVTAPDAPDLLCALTAMSHNVRVLAFGVDEHDETRLRQLAACGAGGYLGLESTADDVVAAIECCGRDELPCSPRIAAILLRRHVQPTAGTSSDERPLTSREREVLALIDEGLSNKAIAQRLHISVATVKHHVHHILEKLQVRGRWAAAGWGANHGTSPYLSGRVRSLR